MRLDELVQKVLVAVAAKLIADGIERAIKRATRREQPGKHARREA